MMIATDYKKYCTSQAYRLVMRPMIVNNKQIVISLMSSITRVITEYIVVIILGKANITSVVIVINNPTTFKYKTAKPSLTTLQSITGTSNSIILLIQN
uniref:Uncharacterized protein n=1 Tax=Glossina palpalis gambiensis TaxID=67801 RepID=A0A1B0AXR2_9MUSC